MTSVFVGRMGSTAAPAQGVTLLAGADLSPESPRNRTGSVPLNPSYEHLLVPIVGEVGVSGAHLQTGQAIYLGTERDRLDLELPAGPVQRSAAQEVSPRPPLRRGRT